MKRFLSMVVAAMALFLVSGALVFAHDSNVTMMEQNASGQNGTTMLHDNGDGTTHVVVNVSNGTSTAQPAHIHMGTCANLDPKPAYPLSNVVNGVSESMVPVDIHTLTTGGFAVNVHKSATEASIYTSCGNILAADAHSVGMPRTGNADTSLLLAAAALAAIGMVMLGFGLTRRSAQK